MKRKALLVGINYPGTSSQLRGCINDVISTREMLVDRYDFKLDEITTLLDHDATARNMNDELDKLTADVSPGDIVYFHFSGHGSQLYNPQSHEENGLDEILCPIDLDWRNKVIRDKDLKRYFDRVPRGAHFTVVLDCCHSGTGLDQTNQYQPEVPSDSGERSIDRSEEVADVKERFIPMPHDMQVQSRFHKATSHKMCDVITNRSVDDAGMVIAGCRDYQTAADARINGKYVGACTYFLVESINVMEGKISYQRLIERLNHRMVQYGFTQRPELNGPAFKFGLQFLLPYEAPLHHDDPRPVIATRVENSGGSAKPNWLSKLIAMIKRLFS